MLSRKLNNKQWRFLMNQCDERHDPKFQIKYVSGKGSNFNPIWLVCERCMDKLCFVNKKEILSIEVLV